MKIINLANSYYKLPSEVLKIEDEYLAFCFDEACMYISNMLLEKDENREYVNMPVWSEDRKKADNNTNKDFVKWAKGHRFDGKKKKV